MKLFLLEPKENIEGENPWKPWYDKVFAFVVRAENEDSARKIAILNKGNESRDCWANPDYSSCEELKPEGEPGVIIRDYASA